MSSTGNEIRERGATALSDALKSNTTLKSLQLWGEDKGNNTQMVSINNSIFSILIKSTVNEIGDTGATSLSDALKSNTTLATLDLSGEHKRNNTQMTQISNPLFHSHQINRQQHWEKGGNIN